MRAWVGLACVVAACSGQSRPSAAPASSRGAPVATRPAARSAAPASQPASIEDEVLANLRALDCGAGSHVADAGLPPEFLRRAADRVIRSTFQQRYRLIYPDVPLPPTSQPSAPGAGRATVTRLTHEQAADERAYFAALRDGQPSARGFRARVPWPGSGDWPIDAPRGSAAAEFVARELPRRGLLATLAGALDRLTPPPDAGDVDTTMRRLRAIGFPVDWLDAFAWPDGATRGAGLLRAVLAARPRGTAGDALARQLGAARFDFRRSEPRLVLADESGGDDAAIVRLQTPGAIDWQAASDGGFVEIIAGVASAVPRAGLLVQVYARNAEPLVAALRGLPLSGSAALTLVTEPLPLAQWAQDNGKSGRIGTAPAVLVPRFASQGEVVSRFLRGENAAWGGAQRAGIRVVQSPLMFQGGNVLVVRDARRAARVLVIGEAEVCRNLWLGLSAAQVIAAFRVEFDVSDVVVLPAVSHHIDYEVTFRGVPGETLAFVVDSDPAVRAMLRQACDSLQRGGLLSAAECNTARDHLAARRDAEFLDLVAPRVFGVCNRAGQFPLSLALLFRSPHVESGPGNLLRVVRGLDWLASKQRGAAAADPRSHADAFLRSLQRRDADRAALHAALAQAGFHVVPVPALAEDEVSVAYLNAVQLRSACLLSGMGGYFAPLDEAVAAQVRKRLPADVDVRVVPTADTQRWQGALHCVTQVFPESNDVPSSRRVVR